MWEIYNDLIDLMPRGLEIKEFMAGINWSLVESLTSGMAMTPREGETKISIAGHVAGMKVYEAAQLIKSWNNYEAALGLAAINSVINVPEKVEKLSGVPLGIQPKVSVFDFMKEEIRGKKVAVIGHFKGIEQYGELCWLSVLERIPQTGDLPDPACEYILPEQDFVFITGTTLINKTLPRLLELSKNSYVTLVGPSVPMTPKLFKYGIDLLAGTVVTDRNRVWNLLKEGGSSEFFNNGASMVKMARTDIFEGDASL